MLGSQDPGIVGPMDQIWINMDPEVVSYSWAIDIERSVAKGYHTVYTCVMSCGDRAPCCQPLRTTDALWVDSLRSSMKRRHGSRAVLGEPEAGLKP